MNRTTPVSRAFRLALALAFMGCLLVLPGFDARAGSGADQAPAKVRDGARAQARASHAAPQATAITSQPVPQATAIADSANAPIVAAAQVSSTALLTRTVRLPLIRATDENWIWLGQPADGAAVNYLYISQKCIGGRPEVILAGTDKGLYQYGTNPVWARKESGLTDAVQVSHVFSSTPTDLYVASYNLGLYHSANAGSSFTHETVPNNDSRIYWLAQSDQYLFAAGRQGLYRRNITGGAWLQIQSGAIYTVAVFESKVYAVQIGSTKDTLLISNDEGNTWPITRQLPGAVNFVQSLDADPVSGQVLIGAVNGGVFTLDGADNIVPFSQGLSQTVYGTWRDLQKRIYMAAETPGGLRRFPQSGGASNLDVSRLPTGASLTAETLYTVNGSTICTMIAVGAESGGVWMRRAP